MDIENDKTSLEESIYKFCKEGMFPCGYLFLKKMQVNGSIQTASSTFHYSDCYQVGIFYKPISNLLIVNGD